MAGDRINLIGPQRDRENLNCSTAKIDSCMNLYFYGTCGVLEKFRFGLAARLRDLII